MYTMYPVMGEPFELGAVQDIFTFKYDISVLTNSGALGV
jgi:hypothetical protein